MIRAYIEKLENRIITNNHEADNGTRLR
jgi:hypothetical protein